MNYTYEASLAELFAVLLDKDAPVLNPAVPIATTAGKMEAFLPEELLACISPSGSGSAKSKGGRPKKDMKEEPRAKKAPNAESWRTSSYLPFLYNAYKNARARREAMAEVLRKNPVSLLLEAERKAQNVLYEKGDPRFDSALLEKALTAPSLIPVKSAGKKEQYVSHIRYYMRQNPEKAFSRAFLALLLSEQTENVMDLLFPAIEYSAADSADLMPHADELLGRGLYKEAKELYQAVMDDRNGKSRAEAALKIGRICRYHYKKGTADRESYEYFLKALELSGDSPLPDALYELYLCERDGIGTRTNDEEAWAHLLKAAHGGCVPAILEAGGIYYTGNERFHVISDKEAAERLYRTGAMSGDAACEAMYGKCLLETGRKEEARHYLFGAARQGNVDASLLLTETDLLFSEDSAAETLPESMRGTAVEDDNSAAETDPKNMRDAAGLCFANAENEMAETFISSLPAGWNVYPLALFEKGLTSHPLPDKIIVFFLNEQTMKNLRDLDRTIRFLEFLPMGRGEKKRLIEKIHFYLRTEGDDSLAVKMVDSFNSANELRRLLAAPENGTFDPNPDGSESANPGSVSGASDITKLRSVSALRKDWFYRIRICNPIRDASSYLLSHSPLFLPSLAMRRAQPRILILGGGVIVPKLIADMLSVFPYTRDGKPLNISVLSDNADAIREELEERMPELLARTSPFSSDLHFYKMENPEIAKLFLMDRKDAEAAHTQPEGKELLKAVREANYYIVAGDDGAENVEAACSLRSALLARSEDYAHLPFIAAWVRDNLLSRHAAHFSVVGEGLGFSWYNNYNLFCFGSSRQLYTFSELENGVSEKRAYAIHSAWYGSTEKDQQMAASDYWCRFYNRDSSHMTALTAVYKAYLAGIALENGEGYGIAGFESKLADSLKRYLADPQHLEDAARAEHVRWISFMVSRGWRQASPVRMKGYIEAGNPRQQLYLAKLHPCITSWQRLPEVEKEYNAIMRQTNPKWRGKKLIRSDYDIMNAMPELLRG